MPSKLQRLIDSIFVTSQTTSFTVPAYCPSSIQFSTRGVAIALELIILHLPRVCLSHAHTLFLFKCFLLIKIKLLPEQERTFQFHIQTPLCGDAIGSLSFTITAYSGLSSFAHVLFSLALSPILPFKQSLFRKPVMHIDSFLAVRGLHRSLGLSPVVVSRAGAALAAVHGPLTVAASLAVELRLCQLWHTGSVVAAPGFQSTG